MQPDNSGLRYDADKVRYDLIPIEWEHALALVLTAGAKKYADRNWEKGMKWSKVLGPLRRHVKAWLMGQSYDQETGCHHLAMVAWNALALMTYELRNIGEMDFPRERAAVDFLDAVQSRIVRSPAPSWAVTDDRLRGAGK
jgi:hypothetical protein